MLYYVNQGSLEIYMNSAFAQASQENLSTLTQTFRGDGPFKMGHALFKNKEEWLAHSETLIRGLNLDCVSIEEIESGYRFSFTSSIDQNVFNMAALGDSPGEYTSIRSFDDKNFMEIWHRAAVAHMNDKGIKPSIEKGELEITYKFSRKSDSISFIIAAENGSLDRKASAILNASRPDNKFEI